MSNSLMEKYAQLPATSQHLLQLSAIQFEGTNRTDLVKLSNAANWRDEQGRQLIYGHVQKEIRQLIADSLLVKTGIGVELAVNPELRDFVVQRAIHERSFEALATTVEKQYPSDQGSYGYYGPWLRPRKQRDARIAFYRNQHANVGSIQLVVGDDAIGVLRPFDQEIFAALDPVLQKQYLREAVTAAVACAEGSETLFAALETVVDGEKKPTSDIAACIIDVYAARGDLDGLRKLNRRLGGEYGEAEGCAAFLTANWDQAESLFDTALTRVRRTTRKKKAAIPHLAGLFHIMLLLRKNSLSDRKRAVAMVDAIREQWPTPYHGAAASLKAALDRQANPTNTDKIFASVDSGASAISQLVAACAWRWIAPEQASPVTAGGMQSAIRDYAKLGLKWLAAEAAAIVGRLPVTQAQDLDRKSDALHQQLGTVGLLALIQPQPLWKKCLQALTQWEAPTATGPTGKDVEPDERMIWELSYGLKYQSLHAKPFVQKRGKRGQWTKGRPVALSRLEFSTLNPDDFPFLTDQDKRICRSIRSEEYSTGWGRYTETMYHMDDFVLAQAIIGHPFVFREGDRSQPLEVAGREPQLVVAKRPDDGIAISLDPPPSGEKGILLQEDGPHRLVVVTYSQEHHRLHATLGGKLTVPASGEAFVLEALQAVAPVIAIHSEVGGAAQPTAESISADPRPHLHLTPYQDGLRADFFVRPFGQSGPFFRPGEGGENVFAPIEGQPRSTTRDLGEEQRLTGQAISDCPSLSALVSLPQGGSEGDASQLSSQDLAEFYFPTPVEALELVLELQPLVDAASLVLHWPQGKKFSIAGHADASQFRVSVRKDRDWFAASGKLKVDDKLSLDLLQLVELIEASPSRFVQLDDGQFLALTEKLRQRVEEMTAYSERKGTKLRFPPIRAAAMEDLGETFDLKADQHWKHWMQRIRESSELVADVPSTLQTDLRDYQLEGYRWLRRLAHWGAGGCLADDMGLGKTIQALALLLERSSGGPALVVAPTSVAFNWQNEAARFAPTLNVRLLGPGDREGTFENLGPRDVVVCSYGLLHIEAERFQSQAWHTVILDEAQAIKNMATKRSQAAMGLSADFRLIMTGTPLENHLGELWNLFQFINPGLLGTYESFQQRFAIPIERDGCRDTRLRLKKLIQPFILRRTKTQVLQELPSRTEVTLQVELGREEAALYEALRQRALEKLSADDDPQHLKVLAELMRLRRACCHPKLAMPDVDIEGAKLTVFSKTIDDLLENKHKVLVFSQFVDHLTILRHELDGKGVAYQYLDGSTPAQQRKLRVEAFQSGEGDVFLISLKAGGLGLNLTAADYVIHMDPWWNPAVEDQASDRAHRLGQQRPVTIYRLITQGTIEERIVELHRSKRDLADSLLEGTDISGKLTAEELLGLIRS